MPVRVLMIVPAHDWGGAERMAALVARSLRARHHDVTVGSAYPENLRDGLADGPAMRLHVDPDRKWTAPLAVVRLLGSRFDAVYTMHRWPALLAMFCGSGMRPPVTYHVQSLVRPRPCTWWGDRTIAVSEVVRRHAIANGAAPSRTVVVPNAPAFSQPDRSEIERTERDIGRRLSTSTTAMFAGRLVQGKGVEVLLRALTTVPDLGLVVVGDGELREDLQRFAADVGLADRVWFVGWVEDVSPWMDSVDIGVVPSDTYPEGMPLSALEFMAAGLGVVVTDLSGLPEAVTDGADGLVVPRGDPEALSRALGRLAEDPDLRSRLGSEAVRTVEARFDPVRLSDDVAEVIVEGIPHPGHEPGSDD